MAQLGILEKAALMIFLYSIIHRVLAIPVFIHLAYGIRKINKTAGRRFNHSTDINCDILKGGVTCWGDGSPLREFLYVNDLANLRVFLMNNYSGKETDNADTGKELTIKYFTKLVADIVGYKGKIFWDKTRPNSTSRKLLDISKAATLGWIYKTKLSDSIRLAYDDFLNNPMRAER